MRPKPLIPTYRADRFKFITRANTANEGGGGRGGDLDRHVGFGAEVADGAFSDVTLFTTCARSRVTNDTGASGCFARFDN